MAIKAAGDLLAIDGLSSSGRRSLAYKGRNRAPASPFSRPCTPCTAVPSTFARAAALFFFRPPAIAGRLVLLLTKRALPRGLLVLFRRVRHPHKDPAPKSVPFPAEPSRRRRFFLERRPSSISAVASSSSPTPHVQRHSKVRRPSPSLLLALEMPCAVAGLASIYAVRRRPWRLLSVTRAASWSPWSGSPSPPLCVEPIRVAKGCPQFEINPAPASLRRTAAAHRASGRSPPLHRVQTTQAARFTGDGAD
jgi:hypothetical protein